MVAVELRVLVISTDEREQAADRIEDEVRRALSHVYPPEHLYVDRMTAHARKTS